MIERGRLAEILRGDCPPPPGGAIEIIDGLLELCARDGLRLEWVPGRITLATEEGSEVETIEVALRPSLVRVAAARVATRCNEQAPGAVSPYGGEGTLFVGRDRRRLTTKFANTPDEQRLEVWPQHSALPANGDAEWPDRVAGGSKRPVSAA